MTWEGAHRWSSKAAVMVFCLADSPFVGGCTNVSQLVAQMVWLEIPAVQPVKSASASEASWDRAPTRISRISTGTNNQHLDRHGGHQSLEQ
jgi:hypothetical protein